MTETKKEDVRETYMCMCMCMQREKEREKERENMCLCRRGGVQREADGGRCMRICMCMCRVEKSVCVWSEHEDWCPVLYFTPTLSLRFGARIARFVPPA